MRVVVTGGAGFIGSHSVRLLRERGHDVTVIDDLSSGKRENVPQGVELRVADVRSVEVPACDAVLHLAAQMDVRRSVADPLFDASVNVLGTLNVLETARKHGCKRVVFASSGGALYGEQEYFPAREDHPRRPASPYGVSKLCGEEYLAHYALAHGLQTFALRYANVYGPAQNPHGEAGVVAIFLHKMLRGEEPVINGDGGQTRDYVHVHDVARINVAALESSVTGAANVGTARETDVNTLARVLGDAVGWKKPFQHGPAKPGEQRRSCIDPSLAEKLFGWKPQITLEDGLRQTAEWFRAHR